MGADGRADVQGTQGRAGDSVTRALVEPDAPASYVVGINVRGQFFTDLWLSLSPHCNAFIGVKGSGKTSVLECLRFALGSLVPESRKEEVQSHLSHILGQGGTCESW